MARSSREPYAGPVYDFILGVDHTLWAQGVLVHNCSPCSADDGREFATMAEVLTVYPTGGNVACLGGPACRCTAVAILSDES